MRLNDPLGSRKPPVSPSGLTGLLGLLDSTAVNFGGKSIAQQRREAQARSKNSGSGSGSGGSSSFTGGGSGGSGGSKTSTYTQTIKGSAANAASAKNQAELLGSLAASRERGRKLLDKQLNNAKRRNRATRRSVVSDLLQGQRIASEGYNRLARDATENLSNTTAASILNRAREGSSAMAELSNMQAGETDRIRGMAASIRNMQQNLTGGTNDYAAAITGINNSIGDLNNSTRSNINNALREENTNNASAWAEYATGQQQAYSDMVDLWGSAGAAREQQADALVDKTSKTTSTTSGDNTTTTQTDSQKSNAGSLAASKGATSAYNQSKAVANHLADWQGKAFNDPIITIGQMNATETDPNARYTPTALKANQSNLDALGNGGKLRKLSGPEGSSLRKMGAA